jgi:hypothetical protein
VEFFSRKWHNNERAGFSMKKRKWRYLLVVLFGLVVLAVTYVRSNPLVFNESFWGHAHCIKIAGFELSGYAQSHGGKFP